MTSRGGPLRGGRAGAGPGGRAGARPTGRAGRRGSPRIDPAHEPPADPLDDFADRGADVVIVGAGHNGLVAAVLLARAGLTVIVCERAAVVGGACRTERPFADVPGLGASTGAYLLGLMPPELLAELDLDLPLLRRDPHYLLPRDGRALLLGGNHEANRKALAAFGTEADAIADAAMAAELAALRADLGPSWLAPPLPVEETAERYVRPALRRAYVDLVRGSAADYLERFGFATPEIVAMYAVTDGMPGSALPPTEPGTGANLLVHSMCRLPGAGGTWMAVAGGMGTVTTRLAGAARAAGATVLTGADAVALSRRGGTVDGVELADGRTLTAPVVLAATDPWRLRDLAGGLPAPLESRLGTWAQLPGMTLKINLALRGRPAFTGAAPGALDRGATVHLLPPGPDVLGAVAAAYAQARAGRLPDVPPVELYLHPESDALLRDAAGHRSCALFVQGVPAQVTGSTWEDELPAYVDRMLALVEGYAPGLRGLVADTAALAPPDIAAHFGITGGHIFHVDNSVATVDRMPYATGIPGLYAGAAGCHPAGSVIGAAGHNAARLILDDLA